MMPLLAASLFDNPLVVVAIVIGGMIVNWLAQRRKAQQDAAEQSPADDEPKAANKPAEEADLNEMLRRLLGGEPTPTSSMPPVLPRAVAATQPPPRLESPWVDDSEETPPVMVAARKGVGSFAVPQTPEQAAERFEQLNEQGRHPAKALDLRRVRPGTGTRSARWRDRQKVREAFVASLVFAPPKGLEES